ncbi:MAG: alpha-amylase/4-alpha-glucanotransferase domain-containing protein, partial [Candidatus Limnocylindrales bacterium]
MPREEAQPAHGPDGRPAAELGADDMTARISLSLVLHNHQPVGNFGWVFEEVFHQAYAPMIDALERHPHMKVGLHYTGPLLEWMEANQPEAIVRLQALADGGRVEILGGGLYEPILVSLPQRDRHAQLVRMRERLERLFGAAPRGAWLAERVWEPSLPFDLAEAGYDYTVLDDNHLRGASIKDADMWGTYTTDDQGRRLTILGTEKGLRYLIPFRPVGELIDYLRAAATEDGHRLGVMGDDGEKFGAWPGTQEHCWGEGRWVDDCFESIAENAEWLTTVTPSEWISREPPVGRIYVPTSSYVEMTQWALPPEDANTFARVLGEATKSNSPALPFLSGGLWRNFQARYREINDLHKQMIRVSDAVEAAEPGPLRDRALDHLYRGQSNDCYWHGLFGGVYIVHMRMATLAELIAAEDLVAGESAVSGVGDYDLDGIDEVILGSLGQTVLVDVAEGAGIGSWDVRASRVALASVMRRRREAYHEALRAMETAKARGEKTAAKTATSIHDELLAKESGLSAALVYDDHERRSGLVRLVGTDGRPIGDSVNAPWKVEQATDRQLVTSRTDGPVTLRKTVALNGGRLDPALSITVEAAAATAFEGALEIEMNINLSGGGGNPDAYYSVGEAETRQDAAGFAPAGTDLAFGNRYEGVEVAVSLEPAADAAWVPVETVS